MRATGVILGIEDVSLQEEVLHFLDRLPYVRVLGASDDGRAVSLQVHEHRPDAAVLTPHILATSPSLDGAAILVVSQQESIAALRASLRAGARGFYRWPQERDELARDAERAARPKVATPTQPGRVVAVYSGRGGAGVTFLATNLAAAMADRGEEVALVDLDSVFGEVGFALGILNEETPTIAELVAVAEELTEEHLDRVLHTHPRGFRVLLAPHRPILDGLSGAAAGAIVRGVRAGFDGVVLHLPRALDPPVLAALEESDEILLVTTLDVLSLRDTRRALAILGQLGLQPRCRLVLNQVTRGEVVPADAERALGLPTSAVIRVDRSVRRAQNRGELLASRSGPAARGLAALARTLLPGAAE
jgi:pilus assembly protein CpaE